ncbi:MAG: EamA family transporter [Verrucomicrobiota bacterium]|jgi:drug/metabolite transporter (DMT)-like permease|nr:EamA family transporter [Verrucomicrobiota bacterium]
MLYLIAVSLIWAFSFGLIGNQLAGLPPGWTAWIRLLLAALVFLPFVRRIPWKMAGAFALIGAVQFGWMYLAYMASFHYLQSHEVALFTVTTPLFVAALYDVASKKFHPRNVLAAGLAVAGAGVILWKGWSSSLPLLGILLVQLSNVCFAAGQLGYRTWMRRMPVGTSDHQVIFWLYAGAALVLLPIAASTPAPTPSPVQWAVLVYLGVVASGLCFFLWNRGVRMVGAGTLAVMNNLKIPLSVAASLLVFRETAGRHTWLAGTLLLCLGFLPVRRQAGASSPAPRDARPTRVPADECRRTSLPKRGPLPKPADWRKAKTGLRRRLRSFPIMLC